MNRTRRIGFATRLIAQGQVKEAAELTERLLADSPDDGDVHYLACEVAMAQDRPSAALERLEQALAIDPLNPDYLFRKAAIQVVLRRGIDAQKTVAELAAMYPHSVTIQLGAASVCSECGNHAGAAAFLDNVAGQDRNDMQFLSRYATNQFFLGNTDAAERAIADFLALEPPAVGRKLLLRSMLRKQTHERNNLASLRAYLERPLPPKEAVNVQFALARELEDLGEFEAAFEALSKGAALQKQLVRYNPSHELDNIRDLVRTFRPGAFAAIPESPAVESPVFIVGLPRTGTTLVERLVTRQDDVRSAEESYDFTLAFSSVINEHLAANPGFGLTPLGAALKADYGEIARRYLANMRGMLGDAAMYLDKTPFNYLYCGLIRKAFPQARIIHMVRDPMDACYAVFKTLFSRAYYYSYDLGELADYYVAYREVMDHWHRLMPGSILDVRDEALVSDPATISQQIADYLGIPWSEELLQIQDSPRACATASAAQVREPIYTRSVGLWRNVAAQMDPVRRRLEAAGLVDENGDPSVKASV